MHKNDQIKIVHVISNLGNGGAEKFVVELANEQVKNHDVSIISFRNVEDWMFPPQKIKKKVTLYQLGKKKGSSLTLFIKLIVLLKRIDPDIVNSHLDSSLRYVLAASFLILKPKYLQTVHSNLNDENKKRLFDRLHNILKFRKKFINICISESIFYAFSKRYKNLKFHHIDNGVKQLAPTTQFIKVKNEFKALREKKTVTFAAIGRFDRNKNFYMLSKLFAKLAQQNKNVALMIIGGNPSESEQKFIIENIKTIKGKNTFLLGSRANVGDYLLNADALILSSRFEGMPIVVLEALSIGLPIVSTPAGGVKDIVENGINGFIADGFEIENLYQAVISFLELSPEEVSVIKLKNLQLFQAKYDIGICSQKYITLYKYLLNNKKMERRINHAR